MGSTVGTAASAVMCKCILQDSATFVRINQCTGTDVEESKRSALQAIKAGSTYVLVI